MKSFDVVIVGAGDVGLGVAFSAASAGREVALIDGGNPGGTCVNNGCVPSKTLIYTADRIMEAGENDRLGFHSAVSSIDFQAVMERMRNIVSSSRNSLKEAIDDTENISFINSKAHFIDEDTLESGGEKIRGKKIFIASGARPSIPLIEGLDTVPYLTNESVLSLEKMPESMVFIGGGYIALEYAHFFSAMGTRVKIINRGRSLLRTEEPEVSELLRKSIQRRVELHMGVETLEVRGSEGGCSVTIKDAESGLQKIISAELVMVAAGRKSNADILRVEHAGLETDKANFIKVDDFLRTNKKHIWAIGDANGRAMFTHAGDREAELAWHNATHRKKIRMDFQSVPHAVYTSPQIASVGLTEEQARKDHKILVGRAMYSDTVMGEAMAEQEGFAKAVVDKGTRRILGFHIIGPHASMLIQEVVNAVAHRAKVESITECMHIFPALSNIIPETLGNLE